MHVPPQTTAREAALMSDMADFFPEITIDPGTLALGVYGEHVADDYVLQPGDRLELYRDLVMDPMQIRRQRALTDKLARGKGKPRKK